MNPSKASKLTAIQVFLLICICWIVVIVGLYALMIGKLPLRKLELLYSGLKDFFVWQLIGFIFIYIFGFMIKVSFVGRILGLYLFFSTVLLLVFSHEIRLPLGFSAFLLWCIFAINTVRICIKKIMGAAIAAWGISAGVMYAALIPVSFFLGLLHVITFWLIVLLAVVLALPGALDCLTNLKLWSNIILAGLDRLNPIGILALEGIWVPLALSFIWTSVPEISPDSVRVHLPVIQSVAFHHGFDPKGGYIDFHRLMPMSLQTLFSMAYVVGSYLATKWLSWFAVAALSFLMAEEVTHHTQSPDLGLFAAAVILAYPFFPYLSTTLYNDHVITLLCFSAFVILFRSFQYNLPKGIYLSACIMGCALQIKYNVFIFCMVWMTIIAFYLVRCCRFKDAVIRFISYLIVLMLTAIPWYAYTFWITDNPLFPYFNEFFQSQYWPDKTSTDLNQSTWRSGMGKGLLSWIGLPWNATFHTSRISPRPDGWIGFWLLALLPFSFTARSIKSNSAIGLGLAGLLMALGIICKTPNPRYWLPAIPLVFLFLCVQMKLCLEQNLGNSSHIFNLFSPFYFGHNASGYPFLDGLLANLAVAGLHKNTIEERFFGVEFSGVFGSGRI